MSDPGLPLTLREAERAIYVDFEGRKGEPPVLLGMVYAEGKKCSPARLVLRHDIVDVSFAALAGMVAIEGCYSYRSHEQRLRTSVRAIVDRAVAQDRVVVGWSRHEINVVREYLPDQELAAHFETLYRDGKATAKRWKNFVLPHCALPRKQYGGTHALAVYMNLAGFQQVETRFGPHRTGANLLKVRDGLERAGSWELLTVKQQRAWSDVLGHNMHDCFGMRHVCLRAARELDAAEAAVTSWTA